MSMIYGHRWTSSFGVCDDGTWLTGLSDVTVEQIKTGIEKCRTRKISPGREDWPPTLTEFRALCLITYAAPYHRPFEKALPSPQNPEIAGSAINAMREKRKTSYNGNAFRPDESLDDYLSAMRKSGLTPQQFLEQRTRVDD
jgi:hypothetical protein